MSEHPDPFSDHMRRQGVRPLQNPDTPSSHAPPPPTPSPPTPDEDQTLFLEAIEGVVAAHVDLPQPMEPVTKKRIPKQRRFEVDDVLDLHGQPRATAISNLQRFTVEAKASGFTKVCVITGKGLHSPTRQAVLRPAVERWICGPGSDLIASYGEAPRALGGAGAFILYLRL